MSGKNPLGYTDQELTQARADSFDVDDCACIAEAGFKGAYTEVSVKALASSMRALHQIAGDLGKPVGDVTVDDIIAWSKARE